MRHSGLLQNGPLTALLKDYGNRYTSINHFVLQYMAYFGCCFQMMPFPKPDRQKSC